MAHHAQSEVSKISKEEAARLAGIRAEIQQRMGLWPSFFQSASDSPGRLESLWRQTQEAYLDNPLPPLFKEKLFAHLSRFSGSPYSMARHCGFLLGRGKVAGESGCKPLTPAEVLSLVQRPFPPPRALNARLRELTSRKAPIRAWPKSGSPLETALLICSVPLFLRTGESERCQKALLRALGPARCERLLALLNFIRMAHFWAETHPGLELEPDVRQLLAGLPALADWIRSYPAAVKEELQARDSQSSDTEAALRASEERYRILAEFTYDWVFWVTPDGAFAYVSPSVKRITGREIPPGMGAEPFLRLIAHPDDLERCLEHLHLDPARETPGDLEFRIVHTDGSIRWIHHVCQPMRDRTGRFLGRRGSNRDITERKQAEEALRASEERCRGLVEQAADGIFIADSQGRYQHVNPAGAQMLGYTPAEICRLSIADVVAPEEAARIPGEVAGLSRGAVSVNEWRFQRKDGSFFFGEVVARQLPDGRLQGTVRDITGRHLARSHAEFLNRLHLELMRRRDPAELVREALGSLTRHLGADGASRSTLSPDESEIRVEEEFLDGRPGVGGIRRIADHCRGMVEAFRAGHGIAVDDVACDPRTISQVNDFRRMGVAAFIAEPFTSLSGLRALISVTSRRPRTWRPDETQLLREAASRIFSAHERALADRALRASEELQRRIFEALPAHIAVVGRDGGIVAVNPAWSNFAAENDAATEPSVAVGANYLAVCRAASASGDPDAARALAGIKSVIRGASPQFVCEYPCHSPWEQRWFAMTVVPLGPHGPGGVVISHFNITERRQAEEDLRKAQEELVKRERLVTIGRLAATVAHEMRTPLTVIQNTAFFLGHSPQPGADELRELLAEMNRAVCRCNDIITDMLDYVRDPSPTSAAFPIGQAISRALEWVRLPENVLLKRPSGKAARCEVCANLDQVARILANLIQNALQAMPHGGELEIAVSRERPRKVCVTVRDTGCGIPGEDLDRIFEPLVSTKVTGIGLGLPIALRYARHNGGRLTVESEAGRGSAFRLTLRAAPGPPKLSAFTVPG